jgi:subtilisin family serine protease
VRFDDFESPLTGRWVTGGTPNTWARTTNVPTGTTGTWLTDSPNGDYPNSSDNWARTTAIDLRGTRDCKVDFQASVDIEDTFFDFLRVETATNSNGPWTELMSIGLFFVDQHFEARFPDSTDGSASAYLRFRFNPDDQFDGNGVFVDDVDISCVGRFASDSYEHLSGTSMATPHVTGVAALVKARNPGFTPTQLRSALLATTDRKAGLVDVVATAGRVNAAKAVNGTVTNRQPSANAGADRSVRPGSEIVLAGSGSDPEGGGLTYVWTQQWGFPVTIRDDRSATARVTAPDTAQDEPLIFRLRVTDPQGATDIDDVVIRVSSK